MAPPVIHLIIFLAALLAVFPVQADAQTAKALRIAVPYLPEAIDPVALDEPVTRLLLQNMTASLILRTKRGDAPLALAASCTAYDQGKRWSFELIPGLAFTNGRAVTGRAVRDSFRLYASQLEKERSVLGSPIFAPVRALGNVSEIAAYDPPEADALSRVEFTLASADPAFARTAGTLGLIDVELIEGFGDDYGRNTHFAAAGSYQIRERRENLVVLEGVPAPGSGVLPRAQLIELVVYPTVDQVLRRLRSGEIDLVPLLPPALAEVAQSDRALLVIDSPLLNLGPVEHWRPKRRYWGPEASETELAPDRILIRRDLSLNEGFYERFELKGVYDRTEAQSLITP